jgi:hypothetical protein
MTFYESVEIFDPVVMNVFLVLNDQQVTIIWFLVIYRIMRIDLVVLVQRKYIDGNVIVTLKFVDILDGCGEAAVFPVVSVLVTDEILHALMMVVWDGGKYSPLEALLVQVIRVDTGIGACNILWQIQVTAGLQYLEFVTLSSTLYTSSNVHPLPLPSW